jgi:hypothetical protein
MSKILSNKSNVDLDYPICRPSLDLDFTQEELDPRITFTRGSIGTRVNRNRLIETVAANQPRFDYDPVTGECKGLLIEEGRSNLRTYSDVITIAFYEAVSATLTQVTTTTPISGLTTATKVVLNVGANVGNTSQGFNFTSGISLTNSTIYTQSIFVKVSGSSIFRLRSNVTGQVFDIPIAGPAPTPTGTIISCSVTLYPDNWSRISWTFTSTTSAPGNRGDHWVIKPTVADGSSGFLVTGAQLEQGPFPTSYIPTSGSAVTRSADVVSMTGTNFSSWYNQSEGSVFASYQQNSNNTAPNFGVFSLTSSTSNNSNLIDNFIGAGFSPVFRITYNGYPSQVYEFAGTSTANIKNRVAFSFTTNKFTKCFNGTFYLTTLVTPITSGIKIPTVNTLVLGQYWGGVSPLNGTISRFSYYPRALKPSQLQYLTV